MCGEGVVPTAGSASHGPQNMPIISHALDSSCVTMSLPPDAEERAASFPDDFKIECIPVVREQLRAARRLHLQASDLR